MKTIKITCALITAAAFTAALPAAAGVLWTDSQYESVSIPLESYALGMTKARQLLAKNQPQRAVVALTKVAKRWPSAEAHDLLAKTYASLGEAERASTHAKLAQAYASGAEPVSSID